MDNWIAKRIRAVALRRVVAWTLALAAGLLLATSDHRYIANFFRGPYPLARADLDELSKAFGKSQPEFASAVEQRRAEWQAKQGA